MSSWPSRIKRIGDPVDASRKPADLDATITDPNIRKLYGPKGEVLRTYSDRPPVGFHQGTRS